MVPFLVFIVIILIVSIIVLNSTISNLKDNIYTQEKRIESKDNTINELSSEMGILRTKITGMEDNITVYKSTIGSLENDISIKEREIESLNNRIDTLEITVSTLTNNLNQKEVELAQTSQELDTTTYMLNLAQKYEDRVKEGTYLSQAYKLLGDYDMTEGIVEQITGISEPQSDEELWLRGKRIYEWIGDNYDYCSDKGFCLDNDNCNQIQFFSPDELLYYGSQDVLCGDCDDKAQLFAGMMYASGVPHDKVSVMCGNTDSGRHCWNVLLVDSNWYWIDPVCSTGGSYITDFVLNALGLESLDPAHYPTGHSNVLCLEGYEGTEYYNPEGYHTM